jgi:hypothetical protein
MLLISCVFAPVFFADISISRNTYPLFDGLSPSGGDVSILASLSVIDQLEVCSVSPILPDLGALDDVVLLLLEEGLEELLLATVLEPPQAQKMAKRNTIQPTIIKRFFMG